MRYVAKQIIAAWVACLMIMPSSVFAGGFQKFELTPEDGPVATKPFIPDSGTSNSDQISLPNVVLPAGQVMEEGEVLPPVFREKPSEREVSLLVDDVLSRMADAGFEMKLSQALTYAGRGDYSGLVSFQKENPEIMETLIASLQEMSNKYSANTPSRGYVDDWLEKARQVNQLLLEPQSGVGSDSPSVSSVPPDPSLIEAMERLYKPIAGRLTQIARGLGEAISASGDSGGEVPSSGGLLKNFSGKAREFILDSFNRAQTNLADGVLSNPLEATAFAAEIAPVQNSSAVLDQTAIREMTLAERYVKGRSKRYQVLDSVYVGREFIYTQKMLHPPANLHPYLKWLLYTRNLTPRMVENYLATREAVGALYEQAKAGRGNIRYRDKVYGAFLPFAETAAGNYELVKPASAE